MIKLLSYRALIIILIALILIGILGFFQIGPFNPENHEQVMNVFLYNDLTDNHSATSS